jgi:hypothetical protein
MSLVLHALSMAIEEQDVHKNNIVHSACVSLRHLEATATDTTFIEIIHSLGALASWLSTLSITFVHRSDGLIRYPHVVFTLFTKSCFIHEAQFLASSHSLLGNKQQ